MDHGLNVDSTAGGIRPLTQYVKNSQFVSIQDAMVMSKCRGTTQSTCYLHLRECEFQLNNRNTDIYALPLKSFKNEPLFQARTGSFLQMFFLAQISY